MNDDLWQHRLYFTRDDGGWEDVFVSSFISPFPDHLFDRVSGSKIPFDASDASAMTKVGAINTQPVRMLRGCLRSVGISPLGGNSSC
jgi:NADH dehydrogenase [ubiquinone] 1 alpha subcomplex assembly factor 1